MLTASLNRVKNFIGQKLGFDHQNKLLNYQSALALLALPEIVPVPEEMLNKIQKRIAGEYGFEFFETSIHKNDMMFHFHLYEAEGNLEQAVYSHFAVGANLSRNLERILQEHNIPISNMLDFGSGYGRVSRFLSQLNSKPQITTSEVKGQSMIFQQEKLGFTTISHSENPASFSANVKFDVIVAISVFTHLPLHRFKDWLRCLLENLKQDGALIFTYKDLGLFKGKESDQGFSYREVSEESLLPFLPDGLKNRKEYGQALVTESFIRQLVANENVEVKFLKHSLAPAQSAVLLLKKS